MSAHTEQRKLAAIMFTDMVGCHAPSLRNESVQPIRLSIIIGVALALLILAGCVSKRAVTTKATSFNGVAVEAACGQCQFKLPGKGCDLAVRVAGQCFFLDGVHIDQLGDAHAADGFCNAIRQARVTGQVQAGRFVTTSFELLPVH